MNLVQLKDKLKKLKLSTSGRKCELKDRLKIYISTNKMSSIGEASKANNTPKRQESKSTKPSESSDLVHHRRKLVIFI